jgi:alpha-L-fucosidase
MKRREFLWKGTALVGLAAESGNASPALKGVQVTRGSSEEEAANSSEDRLGWFREAKFGMMIHWGPYSVLGGEWRGKQMPIAGYGEVVPSLSGSLVEMIMEGLRIPLADYREVARQLNPVKFDAQQWVSLAKATGMKYLVITAKHQDGFAMFHSKVSQYNIVDWTPFKRDPLKELSEACRREGIRFCVYYSQRDDWEDPNSYANYWDFHESKRDYEKYYEGKAQPQVRELLTGYGPIGLIWFDHGMYTPQMAKQMVDLVHSLQPRCLVNSRVLVDSYFGKSWPELAGDYESLGDQELPASGAQQYFEAPQTLNHSWGYNKIDNRWKPPREVVHQLVDIVSKGGNYLLDVGPTGDGIIPQPAVDIFEKVGAWVRLNGESIYGTSASPFGELPWGRCTVKGEKLYLHVFEWPPDAVLSLVGLKNEVKRAYLLLDSSRPLEFRRDEGKLSVRLPGKAVDEDDTVVVLEIAGKPEVDPPVVVQKGNSPIKLTAVTAVTAGKAIKYYNQLGGYHISRWDDPQDSATWGMRIDQPRRYQVWITYAAQEEWEGGKYRILVGSTSLETTVVNTGAFCFDIGRPCETGYEYRAFNIGTVDLSEAREYKLTIRPTSNVGHGLMYLKSIELTPLL